MKQFKITRRKKEDTLKTIIDTPVRPSTSKELAALYGVSTKTLRTWLQLHHAAIGTKVGRYYTALQVRIIFERLGFPN